MKKIHYRELQVSELGFYAVLGVLGVLILGGAIAFFYMEHHGHYVTGMSNQIIWGMPHVFAVFLIVAASGALNVASLSSAFGKKVYKPLAPLSGLLAIALLVGGLCVLVLDLGRPDRLIVAMTYYNFKSIFAWNIFFYTGFIAIVGIYLWMMMEQKMNRYAQRVGFFAFIWRLLLTTGTGSIFGFLVAREAYDAAIMGPMFVVMSFSFGLACFLLVLMALYGWDRRCLGDAMLRRLKNLLGIFIATVLYFSLTYHVTNLYATEHHGVERFILLEGGIYSLLFWLGHILIGSLIPLAILFHPSLGRQSNWVALASVLVILGGLSLLYVIIIGGQAYPLDLFPGMEVINSPFYDSGINEYIPSGWEIALGLGGVALALAIVLVGVRVLRFLPESLADDLVIPLDRPQEMIEAGAAKAA